ncbi:hypothetical protein KP509_1Z073900 [Ceratopteris richardii]|nr:hypothetical protein KP509_1Z073900 [Ceratopteris richardii]
MYDDNNKPHLNGKSEQINPQDLRFKLQKSGTRISQGGTNGSGGIKDLREKLSGPLPPPRAPAASVLQQASSSAVRLPSSAVTSAPSMKHAPTIVKPSVSLPKTTTVVKPTTTSAVKPPASNTKPVTTSKAPTGAAGMTIASFLQSLDLSKYLITFRAEEIDMSVLRVMKEDELKELGIPMGPRKKIALALAAQAKH